MMLFTEVRGLPVTGPARTGPLGTVTCLTVDVASGAVSHVRLRGGRFRGATVLPWDAVHGIGPGGVRVGSADAVDNAPPCQDLLGRRILTEAGTEHGAVLDVAFDTETGRLLALFTTRGEVSPDRLLGLGDYAVVVRTG
ncbi:PRC-barrel domain-containing protein [Streptomyces sp. NPDC058794]|uniref:PRC-barrel domain-containing protein n=1 Tax=unclassified Streptomyces TaxID=2593676 RepID=UPI0036A40BF0